MGFGRAQRISLFYPPSTSHPASVCISSFMLTFFSPSLFSFSTTLLQKRKKKKKFKIPEWRSCPQPLLVLGFMGKSFHIHTHTRIFHLFSLSSIPSSPAESSHGLSSQHVTPLIMAVEKNKALKGKMSTFYVGCISFNVIISNKDLLSHSFTFLMLWIFMYFGKKMNL